MDSLRSRVSKKADRFVRIAQQAPAPVPPPTPAAPGAVPGAAPAAPAAPKAPAAPGAAPALPTGAPPPATPKDVAEQNVQKKIEDEKRQEQQVTKLQETVDTSTQTLETLVDAVVQLKQVIEKGVLGEPDMKDKFKQLQDQSKETKDKKKSPEEFGIDEKNLIVGKQKEERMAASPSESLREARKQRLARELKYHGEGYDPKGLVYHDDEPEEKKYKQDVPAPEITKVKESEIPEIFKTIAMDLSDDESRWTVVDKTTDRPLYVIPRTQANAKTFGTRAFAEKVIRDMRTVGLAAAMMKHLAMPAMDKIFDRKDEAKPSLKEKVEEKKEHKFEEKKEEKGDGMPLLKLLKKDGPKSGEKHEKQEEKDEKPGKMEAANHKRRFARAFRLALAAQQKNLISNPMKAAWYNILTELNVAEPVRVIEAAFTKSALDQFEVLLAKTDEFLRMSDQAFIDVEASIGGLNTCDPNSDASDAPVRTASMELRERAKKSSMLFTTASDSDVADRQGAISQVLPAPKLAGISRLARGL